MDKERIKGSANQAAGILKEVAGNLTGDAKLKAEGTTQKIEGKIQNAIGGLKDAVNEQDKK